MDMNETHLITAVMVRGISAIISKIIAPANPAKDPYDLHMESIDRRLALIEEREQDASGKVKKTVTVEEYMQESKPFEASREEIGVGCLPCARAHFAVVAGTLKEAIRFAREDENVGILHPEVQSRLQTAEEDITVVERHDWTPEKILNSPPDEQAVIRSMLQKLRELRQDVVQIDSIDDLELSAAKAANLSTELRIEVLKTRGITAEKIVNLARKVENGEITLDQAKEEMRSSLTG